jgi:hypothetical protein
LLSAGVTITRDAERQDSEFIFNVGGFVALAATVDVVINGAENTRVVWSSTAGCG